MKVYDLPEDERIKQKKEFDVVYSSGKIIFSETKKIKAIYCFLKNQNNPGTKVAFAIYKKAGNAVWRNRIKRLLRESYRLNKVELNELCKNKSQTLLLVFSLNSVNKKKYNKIFLKDLLPDVISIINNVKLTLKSQI
ncbi:MAG: ribonuclease P protein component [bacterium]